MGAAAVTIFVGGVGGLAYRKQSGVQSGLLSEASGQTAGSWSSGKNTSTVAIHASVLPNGRIFYFAGSGYHSSHQNGPYEARVLNVSSGSETNVSMSEDLFCAGQAPLANGRILLAGGTLRYDIASDNCNGKWHGLKSAYEVSTSGTLTKVASMRHGRWYPTCVTLPNGRVMVTGGYDEFGDHNRLVEIYNPSTRTWSIDQAASGGSSYTVGATATSSCSGAGSPTYSGASANLFLYPRMHLMPSGNIIVSGMLDDIRLWNASSGSWSRLGFSSPSYRHYGTSVLLPLSNTSSEEGKILIAGGSPTSADPATTRVQILDFNSGNPDVRTVDSLQYGRKYPAPVILPDGKVILFGGVSQGTQVSYRNVPEMFDPVTENWSSLSSANVRRTYHQVAILLSDGAVWNAGSTATRSNWELRSELFRPSYYSASRPSISGTPTVGRYGQSITIPTSNGSSVTKATLVKLPDTTHHYDANMRHLTLEKQSHNSSSVRVDAPLNARLAPPGYYYLHIINSSGIPSRARIVRIR
jgi:hypothetical protein